MEKSQGGFASTLEAISQGDVVARQELSADIYHQLRVIARHRLGGKQRTNLDTTILVHEAYLKIAGAAGGDQRQRASFFALASKTMRNLLIDYLRERSAAKRGGGIIFLTLEPDRDAAVESTQIDVLAVESALQALGEIDPRLVEIVECRFFAGMDYDEIGLVHGISERTVRREWRRARAFMRAHLDDGTP